MTGVEAPVKLKLVKEETVIRKDGTTKTFKEYTNE